MGRYKLAANAVGNSKFALRLAAGYANERMQFNVPIGRFGLIGEKLAEMAIRCFAAESMVYRTGGSSKKRCSIRKLQGPKEDKRPPGPWKNMRSSVPSTRYFPPKSRPTPLTKACRSMAATGSFQNPHRKALQGCEDLQDFRRHKRNQPHPDPHDAYWRPPRAACPCWKQPKNW